MASVPDDAIETINKVVFAYRQKFAETRRQVSREELDIPLEEVRWVMDLFTIRIP